MGQNTSNSVWKPCEDLQKTFDLCHCQQRVYNKVLRWHFVIDQILIFHHNLQINSLKILQRDFLDFFSYFVSHSWGIPMMKITGLSHLFKWENLHNWWLTKYFFAPLYFYLPLNKIIWLSWPRHVHVQSNGSEVQLNKCGYRPNNKTVNCALTLWIPCSSKQCLGHFWPHKTFLDSIITGRNILMMSEMFLSK